MQALRSRDKLESVRIHSPEVREKLLDDARENDTQKLVSQVIYNTFPTGNSTRESWSINSSCLIAV